MIAGETLLTVIASMEQELAGLRNEQRFDAFAARASVLDFGCPPLDLQVVGIGKNAAATVRSLLARRLNQSSSQTESANGLLLLGFAGAVDPALSTGELVLSSRFVHEAEPKECLTPDPEMWRHAIAAAGKIDRQITEVESLTVDDLVTTPQAKEAIAQRHGVGVVDMEDYWLASVARDAGVPFLSARVVLDRADQTLPSYLPGLARSRVRAILSTAMMPWRIPVLAGLARLLPEAQRTLAQFALQFAAQVTDGSADLLPVTAEAGALSESVRSTPR